MERPAASGATRRWHEPLAVSSFGPSAALNRKRSSASATKVVQGGICVKHLGDIARLGLFDWKRHPGLTCFVAILGFVLARHVMRVWVV